MDSILITPGTDDGSDRLVAFVAEGNQVIKILIPESFIGDVMHFQIVFFSAGSTPMVISG